MFENVFSESDQGGPFLQRRPGWNWRPSSPQQLLFLPASTHGVHMLSLPAFPRYMVDAADQEKIEASKNELHNLLDKPQLQGIPVSWRWSGWERELVRSQPGARESATL